MSWEGFDVKVYAGADPGYARFADVVRKLRRAGAVDLYLNANNPDVQLGHLKPEYRLHNPSKDDVLGLFQEVYPALERVWIGFPHREDEEITDVSLYPHLADASYGVHRVGGKRLRLAAAATHRNGERGQLNPEVFTNGKKLAKALTQPGEEVYAIGLRAFNGRTRYVAPEQFYAELENLVEQNCGSK